ncbi:hypothetical protein [Deinococcus sp. Leaf326]|uniref:hypothetical protein n=1 Tax=Deinococcus sp. Leaf326 TaxID=1736338 RepID=UPI0006F5B38E|nr:hypothetical protein [Deinococcus sp. Leaf326]KQR22915.1 hypothetical protein ASF71_07035 [Deinococcus sp. Leaf326]
MTIQDSTPIEQLANFDWQKFHDDLTAAIEDMSRLKNLAEMQLGGQPLLISPPTPTVDEEMIRLAADVGERLANLNDRGWTHANIAAFVNQHRDWTWAPIAEGTCNVMANDFRRGHPEKRSGLRHPKKLALLLEILTPLTSKVARK